MENLSILTQRAKDNGWHTIINFNAPVGQFIENYYSHNEKNAFDNQPSMEVPLMEQLHQAVEKTMQEGYWWANTGWAVVYRIYQMKGYNNSIRQFVREVGTWNWNIDLKHPCSYDCIQKPISTGKLIGRIEKWKENGVKEYAVVLGNMLINLLEHPELSE